MDLKAEGLGLDQRPYVRMAGTTVRVEPRPAYFLGIADAPHDTDGDGNPDEIRVTASIHVDEPGEYSFGIHFEESTGETATVGIRGELEAGSQQLTAVMPKQFLGDFTTDGPYARRGAVLTLARPRETVLADLQEDAGPSHPYALAAFTAADLRLLAPPTFSALNTGGGPSFDVLRVSIDVHSPEDAVCFFSATLGDSAEQLIQTVERSGELMVGANTVILEFHGARIASQGVDGPYQLHVLDFDCAPQMLRKVRLGETSPFLYSDFEAGIPDYSLTIPTLSIAKGETRLVNVEITGIHGFEDPVSLAVTNPPAGITAQFLSGGMPGGIAPLKLQADATAQSGTFSLAINSSSATLSKALSIPLTVSDAAVDVQITPASGNFVHPGMTRQFSATVAHASSQDVTWALLAVAPGSVSEQGLYTPPVAIPTRAAAGISATSVSDPSRIGYQTIVLLPPVIITLNPDSTSLRAGESTWIYASLEHNGNTYNPSLTWTSVGPTGSLSKLPLSARYTAPATITAPQTVTIRATFAEDPAAIAEVVLTLVPTIQVSVAPTMATLRPNESQAFTPTVTNDPANAGVTWQVTPQVGTVDAAGIYTAPAVIAAQSSVTLRATSVSDPLRSATATITLLPSVPSSHM